ncbi:MAG: type II secretion system protein J [Pirellulales bacterium]
MRRRRLPTRRLGTSFVELLVVMSTATVILTTSATLIHRILHAQSKAYAFFDVQRSALRLSSQFRRDVRQATDASIRGEGAEAVLTLPSAGDQLVQYRLVDGDVLRVLSIQGTAVSQEEFTFPADTEWILEERTDPRRLILTLAARPSKKAGTGEQGPATRFTIPVRFRVEACLARDWHLRGESGEGIAESKEDSGPPVANVEKQE